MQPNGGAGVAGEGGKSAKRRHKVHSTPENPTATSGLKVLTGGYVSNRGEQALLKQSTILMFAVAIAGIVTGVISGAQSILFDGFFSLIATFIKVLMLITAKLIAKKSNDRFQFGYWHLEPMVLLIEGSFLLLIAIYAFLNGVFGIINGGREIELGLVIIYAAVFTVVEFAYFFYVRHRNRKLQSSLIQFDNISWLVDAMLSVGLLVSFLARRCCPQVIRAMHSGQVYVDPA
jgi:predicted Co/Zn/Cd cation transporter (cation efflux family)